MSYNCQHFSLALAEGKGQDSIPNLLRHLANTLEEEGSIDIRDIVFHNDDFDANGVDRPYFTVYFSKKS